MEINGPWKIKSSEEKYSNPWMKVREDKVIRPDGKDGIFGIVELLPGSSVLPIDNEGIAYLTKEFRYAIREESIEASSGGLGERESFLNAAKRELQEELGIVAEKWDDLGLVNPFTSVMKAPQRLYLARNFKFFSTEREGTELIDLVKFPMTELVRMAMNSSITHAPTVALILKAKIFLDNEKNK